MKVRSSISAWSLRSTIAITAFLVVSSLAPGVIKAAAPSSPVADPTVTASDYAYQLAVKNNPVMDPGFQLEGSHYWDVSGGAFVSAGRLSLPARGSATQEFPAVGAQSVRGASPFVNVGALSFRANGAGFATLTLLDPADGRTFVALDAPFVARGGVVHLSLGDSERIGRSSPFSLTLRGSASGATIDDVVLQGDVLVAHPPQAPNALGAATRGALPNGGLEGPSGRENGYRTHYEGAAISSIAHSGSQSVDLAVGGATPAPWYALGQVIAYTSPGVELRELESFSFFTNVPAPLTQAVRFQAYFSLDADGDGVRDHCLLHGEDVNLAQTAGWVSTIFDQTTRYYMGGADCEGGANAESLQVLQANPLYANMRVLSVHVQTNPSGLAPWPVGQPVLIDDLNVQAREADNDSDGVPNAAESDMTDNYALFIDPQDVAVGLDGAHASALRGSFIFNVTVERYEPGQRTGLPIPVDPARGFVLNLFDISAAQKGGAFWKDPPSVYWSSDAHPGSITRNGAHIVSVRIDVADLPSVANGELRAVGAWAYYNVADNDTYTDVFGGSSEPVSDFFSLARNAVRGTVAADALKFGLTPLVMSNPPSDVDGDGYGNTDEVLASATPDEVIDAPLNPKATPLDRDGDGFSNSEEDRNNDGTIDTAAGETDPDNFSDHPRPSVTFTYSPPNPGEGDLVTFRSIVDYSAPIAPPGSSITSIKWRFGDGTMTSGANVTHRFNDSGAFNVSVTATENHGATGNAQLAVLVINAPPIAAFDRTSLIDTSTLAVFNASASRDPDGSIARYVWSWGDGSPNATTQTAQHRFPNNGRYTVCLTVYDDHDLGATLCEDVPVANIPPIAAFTSSGPARDAAMAATRIVNFTDGSSDPDGRIVSWRWDFGDQSSSTTRNTTHAYAAAATYAVTLTVTDDDGGVARITTNLAIVALPLAEFTWAPSLTAANQIATFTDQSTSANGAITAWSWNFGDGSTSTQSSPTHAYADNGTYNVTLSVKDAAGVNSDPVRHAFFVSTTPPVAAFTTASDDLRAAVPAATRAVRFDDRSTDADGTVVSWLYDFGDGTNSTNRTVRHTYATAGTFTVTLTVTDDDGITNRAVASLVVLPLPQANFTWTPTTPTDRDDVTYKDLSTSPNGAIASWAWSFGDGTNATGAAPHHTHQDNGTYAVRLVITDVKGIQSDPTTRMITVLNIAPTSGWNVQDGLLLADRDINFTDASADADGNVSQWSWNFGDGGTSTSKDPKHSYVGDRVNYTRNYTVTLTVTDNDGAVSTIAARLITVYADTNHNGVPDTTDPDIDGDGYSNADEIAAGSDPKDAASTPGDIDGDGVPNVIDRQLGSLAKNPKAGDRDPCFPFTFTDRCKAAGGATDTDKDGWTDQQEDLLAPAGFNKTDANKPPVKFPLLDRDGDGIPDDEEAALCSRPATQTLLNSVPGKAAGECKSITDYQKPAPLSP